MQAHPKTIREILHTGEQYIIPLFQRYYSWGKENWERLRLDVWALIENGSKPVHFLGPLVCHLPSKMPGSTTSFQLIDGQQRITTLTIFLAAIRDVARSRGLNDLADEITEDYLLHKRKQGSDRYKILPRLGDREVLTEMVEGRDLAGLGLELVREVGLAVGRAVENPLHFLFLRRRPEVRRVLTRRFPYRVFFIVRDDAIIVFAVLHAARHDRLWRQRL